MIQSLEARVTRKMNNERRVKATTTRRICLFRSTETLFLAVRPRGSFMALTRISCEFYSWRSRLCKANDQAMADFFTSKKKRTILEQATCCSMFVFARFCFQATRKSKESLESTDFNPGLHYRSFSGDLCCFSKAIRRIGSVSMIHIRDTNDP